MNLFQHPLLQFDRIFTGIMNRVPYMMTQPMRVTPVIIATPSNCARSLSHPPCMAPEQMACAQTHTHSDIYGNLPA